jgi:hypothetical protein
VVAEVKFHAFLTSRLDGDHFICGEGERYPRETRKPSRSQSRFVVVGMQMYEIHLHTRSL